MFRLAAFEKERGARSYDDDDDDDDEGGGGGGGGGLSHKKRFFDCLAMKYHEVSHNKLVIPISSSVLSQLKTRYPAQFDRHRP